MAADIYVADGLGGVRINPADRSVQLNDGACYWHLYRYFEGAKVQRSEELVDLYGAAEISGYELDRLEDELIAARTDAARKPDQWKVLTGWNESPSRENEIWRTLEKDDLLEVIARLLWLIDFAREQDLSLIVCGD